MEVDAAGRASAISPPWPRSSPCAFRMSRTLCCSVATYASATPGTGAEQRQGVLRHWAIERLGGQDRGVRKGLAR